MIRNTSEFIESGESNEAFNPLCVIQVYIMNGCANVIHSIFQSTLCDSFINLRDTVGVGGRVTFNPLCVIQRCETIGEAIRVISFQSTLCDSLTTCCTLLQTRL